MKSRLFMLVMVAMTLAFSACGGNSAPTPPPAAANEWAWKNGANIANQWGTYGNVGVPDADQVPGGRQQAAGWVDKAGTFWLFGGYGYDADGHSGLLNDLWSYGSGEWTWMSGVNVAGESGIYGTQGVAALTNVPGARSGAVTWTDAEGNLWLFGGYGYGASTANVNVLNDLWEYSAGQWTWMGGSSANAQPGTYGTPGVSAPTNIPGARRNAIAWTDSAGNFWLFGGNGVASPGNYGDLNDLWEYSAGEWTWISGSNVANQQGVYGSEGTAAPDNVPGARFGAVSWTDASGNLWIFGGSGYDSTGANGNLNDLWEYSAGQWTWMGGSNLSDEPGTYGTLGSSAPGNIPGARNGAVKWIDAAGNLWLAGGSGYDSMDAAGWLNDLWEYSAGQWTWVNGSNVNGQSGAYGTMSTAAPGNVPGARSLGLGWTDAHGNLWLYGGNGVDSLGTAGYLNDSWEYNP